MAFNGKAVLITGASGGIGRATALKFARLGASVALFGRNQARLEAVAAEAEAHSGAGGATFAVVPCDITCADAIKVSVATAADKLGGLDVLVNNAGVLVGSPAYSTSNATFDANMNTNTRAPYLMMDACYPFLKDRRGNVVNVSSVTGMQSFANSMAYCVSKAGTDMMTKCAALDFAPEGVRVNSVNPGVVKTELQRRGGMSDEAYAAFLERSKVTHPLGRVAEPEEVAELISFLADNAKAGFITGAVIPIDGGRACLGAR